MFIYNELTFNETDGLKVLKKNAIASLIWRFLNIPWPHLLYTAQG